MNDISVDPNAPRRPWKFYILTAFCIVVLAAAAGWAGPTLYKSYRTRQFEGLCQSARDMRDWRSLRVTAADWVKWDPQSAQGWLMAAIAAQEQEDLDDLAHCLGQVPQSDDKALVSYLEKANLEWTALNRPLEALKTSELILGMDSRILEVHSRIISFYAMNLQRAPMLRAVRDAIQAGAEPKEAYAYVVMADLLTFTNGADLNSRWLASSPDEARFKIGLGVHTAMTVAMSIDSTRTEDTLAINEEATRQLNWFLENDPHDPVLLTYIMYRAYQSSAVERVGELLQQVDERGMDDHMIWVFRCWYHTMTDDFQDAEQAARRAIELHPMSPLAHHEYANLLRRLGKSEVKQEQYLAAQGRELRSQLLQLPTVADIDAAMLERIRAYAQACGDVRIAESLKKRLQPAGLPSIPRLNLPTPQ